MVKIIFFIIITGILIWESRKSLCKVHTHGFYRFFVFEGMLILILLNINYWFDEPFSALQIVSWVLLVISLIIAVYGFYMLHQFGKSKRGIENTTTLVKTGIYRYIRHPLYSSLLILGWGIFLKHLSVYGTACILILSVLLVVMAKIEEKENLKTFGTEYISYVKTTRMFLPFLF